MKKLLIYFLFLVALPESLMAQTTFTVGASSFDFHTLQAAFDYINLGAVSGDVVLQVIDNTTETATAVLYSSGGGVNYTSVLIYPAVSGLSIGGNLNGPLIDLNGADHVTFDGRVNQSGSPDLNISNTSTGLAASTFRFIESANTNTIQYCNIKGSETSGNGGIIFFSTATTGSGNNGNTINNNYITCAGTNRPVNAIYSLGSSGFENSVNVISFNNIFNFLKPDVSSSGIFISSFSTSWTVAGNSLYETSSFVPAAGNAYYGIQINNISGNSFAIVGNYIGGSSAMCGGTAWTKTNAFNNPFFAVYISAGTSSASGVHGNFINNFDWRNSSNASWTGIHIGDGAVDVGTVTGNTIGASGGTGSITIRGGANNSNVYGINIASSGTVNCQKNSIGSITTANSTATNATNFYGINKTSSAGTTTINNNNIGSASTPNSIQTSSSSTANAQNVYGIYSSGSGILTLSGNTIANISNACTYISASGGQIVGIAAKNGTNTISGNAVYNLSTTSPDGGLNDAASVIGITQTSAISGQTISGDTIYNLSNAYTGVNPVRVIGLNYAGGTGGTNIVEKSFIYGLSQSSSSASSSICGITITSGATTYSNNIINVGTGLLTNYPITGIYETGAAGNNNTLYFNTVYVGGSPTSGSSNTYAFYSNANTNIRNFRDNIFNNARSNNGASGNHYAAYFNYADNTNLTLDYNDYYAQGTGGTLGYCSGNKTSLPIVTGADVSSLAVNPLFSNAGGTTATDYIPTESALKAGIATTVLTDYNGAARGSTPTIGAFEIGPCTNPSYGGTIAAAQSGCSPFDPAAFTSTSPPSGYIGAGLNYKWQQSTTGSTSGFSDIPSSNSLVYDAGALTQTTWFKRLSRVTCKSDWTGAAESNVIMVTVNPLPVANAITGGNAACMGDALSLTSNATGTNPLTYAWTSSITAVATVNNSGVVTTVSPGSTNITYKVTDGSSTACQATSPAHSVTVNPLPIANPITGGPALCINSSLTLTPHATGTPPFTYTWSSSDTSVAVVDNSGILTPVSPGSSIIRYTVIDGSSTSCIAISSAYPVTVNPLPIAGAITGGNAVCIGGSLSLTSHATGTPTLTYTWASSNSPVATVNNTGIVTPVSPGSTIITYTVTDGSTTSCSAKSPDFAVTVNALPAINLTVGGNGTICSGTGTNITVDLSVSGINYQLRNAAGNINVGVPVAGIGGTINLPTGNLTTTTTFNVLATGATTGCSAQLTETAVVTVNPPSVGGTITGGNSSITYGGSTGTMTLTGYTGAVVKWQKMVNSGPWQDIALISTTYNETPDSAGTWQYRAEVKSGVCSDAFSAPFVVNVSPGSLIITSNNQTKTYGDSYTFLGTEFTVSGLVNGDNVTSVTLTSQGSASTADCSGSPYAITPGSASGTGLVNYNITYVNGSFTVNKATLTFTADNISKEFLTAMPDLTYTISGFVNSENQTVLGSMPVIQTTAVQDSPVGTYPINISGGNDNNYTYVYVAGILTVTKISQTITFTRVPEMLLAKDTFLLAAISSSGLTVSFESKDPDIATVTGNVLSGVSRGSARIRAYSNGDTNYAEADTIAAVEISTTHKDIMNLFTPNGDGFNDYWELPELASWGKCDVRVYNRWGKLVYANPDYNNLWDGTSEGHPLPEGAYYFIIKTENAGIVKGTVNIVR